MRTVVAGLGTGISGLIGFLLIYAHLRCCDGEAGFAQNASIAGLVGAGVIAVAIFAQPAWRSRPLLSAAMVLGWCFAVALIVVVARPSWDDYVFGRDLHLGWRGLAVFLCGSLAAYGLAHAGSHVADRETSQSH